VLWQAITVQQEPLRLNVLQVSKAGIFLVLSLIFFSACRRRIFYISSCPVGSNSPIPLTSPGKYSAIQGASLDTACYGCPSGTWDAHHSLLLNIIVNEFARFFISQAETSEICVILNTFNFYSCIILRNILTHLI
jgi:hypothetical protein